MKYPKNTIKGQKLQFGNPDHIRFVKRMNAIFSGESSFHRIDWSFARSHNKTTETGKPIFHYVDDDECDALVDHIPCPKCQKVHVLLVHIDPSDVWFEELIKADLQAENFSCWNCGLNFNTDDDRYVYVSLE